MNNIKKEKVKKPKQKSVVFVFIDASNLWEAQKAKGKLFDYKKLKSFLKNYFNESEIKIFYYTAYPANGTRDYDLNARHNFFTFLKKGLGFVVRKKELKRIKNGKIIEEKGNMDVEITIDAIYNFDKYSTAVFFSGDSDFLALITHLKNRGKMVYVFSSKNNISKELRTGANKYIDILNISDDVWGGELRHRKDNKRE